MKKIYIAIIIIATLVVFGIVLLAMLAIPSSRSNTRILWSVDSGHRIPNQFLYVMFSLDRTKIDRAILINNGELSLNKDSYDVYDKDGDIKLISRGVFTSDPSVVDSDNQVIAYNYILSFWGSDTQIKSISVDFQDLHNQVTLTIEMMSGDFENFIYTVEGGTPVPIRWLVVQ